MFVLSSADNGRRRRIAREPGSFRRDESPGIISGAKKGKSMGACERDVQCHRQNSHPGEEYTFVWKSMIAVFVLESTGNLLDK